MTVIATTRRLEWILVALASAASLKVGGWGGGEGELVKQRHLKPTLTFASSSTCS